MLCQALELWILPSASEDLGVSACDDASAFPLESFRHDRCPAPSAGRPRELINEVH
ncbi:MAG TPA: hypothetical protein VGG41_14470 [Solirubrobacteraceae bacterium]